MYKNIGKKIKALAAICGIGTAFLFLVLGLILVFQNSSNATTTIIGVIFAIIGPISCWVSSFILFGYGELILQNSEINENIKLLVKKIKKEEENEQEKTILKKVIMDETEETEEDEENVSFFYSPIGEQSWKEQKTLQKK